MKTALQLCSLALNPVAPSPTANMVKLEDGFMIAYGGTFCIRVPMPVSVGACFNPQAVSTFFRKERKAVSYTLHKKKLVLQEGKEKLSVPFLPPEEMPTLDVLSKPHKVELDTKHLKSLADVVDPAHSKLQCQGISFRYGMMEASNGNVVISAVTDFPDALEFNLPVASAKALLRFKTAPCAIARDQQAVKFLFEDGSSLTSLVICEQLIETTVFYDSPKWTSLKIKPEAAKDLLSVDCDYVIFEDTNATYVQEQAKGVIEGIVAKGIAVMAGKSQLDMLLRISSDLRISEDNFRLMAVSDTCRAISTTRNYTKQ